MYEKERDSFLNAPGAFMQTNEVIWLGGGPEDQDVIVVRMAPMAHEHARIRTGSWFFGHGNRKKSVPKWSLRCVKGRNSGWTHSANLDPGVNIEAWWSGYKGGVGKVAELDNEGPDIMLTPDLTGCTVACRVYTDGSATFAHYNLKSSPTTTLDKTGMVLQAQTDLGMGVTTLSREDYRARAKHAGADVWVTVVGKRSSGRWSFWAQYREGKSSGHQIRYVEMLL